MSRYMSVMLGGIVMMAVSGMLLMWWLIANTGSGFVGLFWILGILTGIGVFAGGAAEAVRASHEPTVRARS